VRIKITLEPFKLLFKVRNPRCLLPNNKLVLVELRPDGHDISITQPSLYPFGGSPS
jgi:hypothetical protein